MFNQVAHRIILLKKIAISQVYMIFHLMMNEAENDSIAQKRDRLL